MLFYVFETQRFPQVRKGKFGNLVDMEVVFHRIAEVETVSPEAAMKAAKKMFPLLCRRLAVAPVNPWELKLKEYE